MKIETILNAMEHAFEMVDWIVPGDAKWERQYNAFRDRILFDFATREATIELCQQRLREKDAEIAHLKETCCHD